MQPLPLYTSCLFSILLNDNIVDIEKPDGMFTFFCCRQIFRIIFTSINLFYHIFKICINHKWCLIRLLLEVIPHQKLFLLKKQVVFLLQDNAMVIVVHSDLASRPSELASRPSSRPFVSLSIWNH